MEEFPLKWRFTDPDYSVLPEPHLKQIHPLDVTSARMVWQFIHDSNLHLDFPFRDGFFQHVESIAIGDSPTDEEDECRIRKWLYRCALPFDRKVLLSWERDWAVETTWKMFVKYWESFYYPASDDLTVCDGSLQWAFLFFHEHEVCFGTNHPRTNNAED